MLTEQTKSVRGTLNYASHVMNLARFPRRRHTEGQTSIEKLSRLSFLLGSPALCMKRDDLLGLTARGSKTRKLEFLVAEALAQGADTREAAIVCVSSQRCLCSF
jgi:hypothetical protein